MYASRKKMRQLTFRNQQRLRRDRDRHRFREMLLTSEQNLPHSVDLTGDHRLVLKLTKYQREE